jgi:hypothetical protein
MLNGDSSGKWFKNGPYPLTGAILPNKRIVAYYGNLYSTRMGILGELPKPQMFAKLQSEIAKWELADPQTPIQPALHYIAVTSQGSAGADGMYRLRMPFNQIDKVIKMADEINAIVFLDVQVGLSTVQKELPNFKDYLKRPNIHFGIDPEFSMKTGDKPGSVIGSLDATDINYIIDYISIYIYILFFLVNKYFFCNIFDYFFVVSLIVFIFHFSHYIIQHFIVFVVFFTSIIFCFRIRLYPIGD